MVAVEKGRNQTPLITYIFQDLITSVRDRIQCCDLCKYSFRAFMLMQTILQLKYSLYQYSAEIKDS